MSHLSNYIHQKYNAPPQLPVAISPFQIQNILVPLGPATSHDRTCARNFANTSNETFTMGWFERT